MIHRILLLLALVVAAACSDEREPAQVSTEATPKTAANSEEQGAVAATDGSKTANGNAGATLSAGPASNQPSKSSALGAGIEALLSSLVRKERGADDPVPVMAKLVALLEAENLGTAETRSQVASVVLKDIFAKAQAAGPAGGELTSLQRAALKELARQIAADLYRRLPVGSATVHLGSIVGLAADVEVPAGYMKAPFSLLGGFAYEEGMKLPEHISALHGSKVGMAGYMMTLEEVEDIHEFVLVESLWSCCFGKPPEVHQAVVVTIPAKKGVDMTPVPILLTGVLDVGEKVEDGFVTSLYRLKADSFKELE